MENSSRIKRSIAVLSGHLWSHRWRLAGGFVFLLGGALVNLALPELLKHFVTDLSSNRIPEHAYWYAVLAAAVFAVQGICGYIRSLSFGVVGQRIAHELRIQCFSALAYKPISFFDTNRVGDLQSRLSADLNALQDAIGIRLSVVIRYGIQVIFGVLLMLRLSWHLSLALLVGLAILVGLSFLLAKQLRNISRKQSAEVGATTSLLGEVLGGIRVVQGFNRQRELGVSFAKVSEQALKLGEQRSRVSAFFQAFVSFLLNTSLVGLALFGLILVSRGTLATGDLVAFLSYGAIVAVSFSFLVSSVAEITQALGAAERAFILLEPEKEVSNSMEGLPLDSIGELKFEAVRFAYPSRAERNVLDGLSFSINRGERVGLVGVSGAGKSTVIALLLKFYAPTGGRITVDGRDWAQFSTSAVRERIAFVPQDPQIFGISLRENLLLGNPLATDEQLQQSLKDANLSDLTATLSHGLDTVLGDRGVQVSGGQRQRIAIARALLKKPDLLLLDEATASLDSANEALVQEALLKALDGRSALIIAHRLSTLRSCNKIVVLDQGVVVEQGSHDELMSMPQGVYRQLVSRQSTSDHVTKS